MKEEENNSIFIKVKYCCNSKKSNKFSDKMYCLITSDHNIPIGEYIFWDWED